MATTTQADALAQPLGAGRADWQTPAARAQRRRLEDAALAVAARDGDQDAFRRLVERYQRKVYWVAHDILLDAEEARDVTQETFVRVYAALGTFDPSRDFLNWLYRIARNLAIDTFRRRRRRALPVENLESVRDPSALPGEGSEDLRGRVNEVLADLPLEYRLALTLREYHGLTPREIAALTDCTYPTARWRLHRARALFRKAWEARSRQPSSPAPGPRSPGTRLPSSGRTSSEDPAAEDSRR